MIIAGTLTPQEIIARYTHGQGFDVIFDTVGGISLDESFVMVRPAGDVITTVGAAAHNLAPLYLRGANLHTVLVLIPIMFAIDSTKQGEILDKISELVECGGLRPNLDPRHFDLQSVAQAHTIMENHQATGKLVIEES
ncbi:MAG: zinc-binding dehydrogenase [Enterobacteriaceae bacterium]